MNKQITIQALKYGDRLHYEWNTMLLEKTETHIVVLSEYGRKLHHYTRQKVFTIDNWAIEFFSSDAWFTVSAEVMNGKIRQYYCNINEPSKIEGNKVSFVDLDLDLVLRNGVWQVVDEDEFESNAILYSYPAELIARTKQELAGLQNRIQNNLFPFDGTLERYVESIPN